MSIKSPTQEQENFLATANTSGSIALIGRAGCAKTTTLAQWTQLCRKSGISTSFSKSTTQELAIKISSRFPAKTCHSICFTTLKGAGKGVNLDKNKMYDLVKTLSNENDIPFELQGEIRSLACMAKVYGIQPDSFGPDGLTLDEPSQWADLADMYDIEFSDEILHWSQEAVRLSNQAFFASGSIDFDDMLYIPLIFHGYRFPRVPVLVADEVQDFNMLQHEMVRRCLLPGGRLIGAGDDRQAIYAFRGALSDSYGDLIRRFNMQSYPLTISFRCPQEVIKVAQTYVPDIQAAESAIQGSVLYPSTLSLVDVPKTVLCRNNAPLMKLALQLLVSGRTVEIAGQDIGKNLIKVVERITKKNLSSDEFISRLEKWKERELAKYPRRKRIIGEKFAVLTTLAKTRKDVEGVKKHLTKLYPDPNDKSYRPADVHLSTAHRAKGKEWPQVLILDPQLFGKYAKSEQEIEQEQNLAYVSVTRAMQELSFIESTSIEGLEP